MESRYTKSRRSKVVYQQHSSVASPTEPTPKYYKPGILSHETRLLGTQNRVQRSPRKNGVSNGAVSLQNSFRSFDGVPSFTKVNGSGFSNLPSKSAQAQKMSERVAMFPRAGTDRSGPSIHLQRPPLGWDRNHLHIVGALADWPDGLNPQHAVSEMSRSTPTRTSAHQPGKSRSNSLTRHSARTNNLPGSMAGQYSQNQRQGFVKPDKQMVPQKTSVCLGSTQVDRGFAQRAQMSQRQESGRPSSAEKSTNKGKTIYDPSPRQSAEEPPEMTVKMAVGLLDTVKEEKLINAIAYIQSQCFREDEARVEVHKGRGAKKLVRLLKASSEEVQRAAAAALRNVVFKNRDNKEDVMDKDGLKIIFNLLDKTHDKETVCQLAGLLWNLSSDDKIKSLFNEDFLGILTKVSLVPSSGINGEAETKRDLIADPKAFLCATACLRNLSSDCNCRTSMKSCENLIDSLAFYTTEAATKRTVDDEITENCVCILQNLTYKVEKDWIPQSTKDQEETQQNTTPKETTCSCFPQRHAELREDKEEAEIKCLPQNNEDPHGVKWLWSAQLVRAYLSLLACSKRKVTLEATMGALQNLTVGNGQISESVARIIEEEKGLQKIKTILENDITLKKPALLLMGNLSVFPDFRSSIFDDMLESENTKSLLHHLDISAEESAELVPILCNFLINLSNNNVQTATYLSSQTVVTDILEKKHNGKAEQVVEKLRHTLTRLKEDKTKETQNSPHLQLQKNKFLKWCNGARHQEIWSTLFHNRQ